MYVTVDNVWASPSTLHMRVTVWGPKNQWRHRYDAAVPLSEIPAEAIEPMLLKVKDDLGWESIDDIPLPFEIPGQP